ncbi:MAG TPA: flagellar hook-associated protein FlgK [Bryobacteraceae bacterium]|nr:flagellar hook-associated protein FlgK [Bryobacteraceae bacterium]
MANLLSSLMSSASALNAYQQALAVVQNNVANASTPGYAKETLPLEAMPLDLALGSSGGVRAGTVTSARDEYAEQAVRRQTVGLGAAQQNVNSLTAVQSQFDVTGTSGIATALNNLFQTFSAWGQAPTDATVRQNVIDQATAVASSFQQAAAGLASVAQDTEGQLQQTVNQVNGLVGQLQNYNHAILQGDRNDPNLDAQINATLEQLSQYADITVTQQSDGSVTVLMNGETPLLVGDQTYALSYALQGPASTDPYPGAPPSAHILASDGRDVTSEITTGQLGALLNVHNQVLPSYLGDATHAGDLNTMAQQFADRVNQLLTTGYVTDQSDGSPGSLPQSGVPLFQYATTTATASDGTVSTVPDSTRVAQSLTVNPNITPDQLAAITGTPTSSDTQPVTLTQEVSNGVPLALSNLAKPTDPQDMVNGITSFSGFYGEMAARVGSALNDATSQLQVQQSTVAQAQNLRQQISGVSLDEEAMVMIQFQRAYEATSRLVTVLDQLTQDTLNILGATA